MTHYEKLLIQAIYDLKAAEQAASMCSSMLLAEPLNEDAKYLMKNLENAKSRLYIIAGVD